MKQTITINVEGDTEDDIDLAIDEAISKIKQGFICGRDSNDTNSYAFMIKDEE